VLRCLHVTPICESHLTYFERPIVLWRAECVWTSWHRRLAHGIAGSCTNAPNYYLHICLSACSNSGSHETGHWGTFLEPDTSQFSLQSDNSNEQTLLEAVGAGVSAPI
jgi:hypothetical protein